MKSNNYNLSLQVFNEVEFFTPVFEAVINSILADATEVKVTLNKQNGYSEDLLSGRISSIVISDDGHGFTGECQNSFENIAQSNRKNCKGLGRLSFIRVFKDIEIKSNFKDAENNLKTLQFKFDKDFTEIDRENQIVSASRNTKIGTTITFENTTPEFIESQDNKCSATFCFSKIIHYVLPHLCFHNCKLVVETTEDREEFDLKDIEWTEWKKEYPIEINSKKFEIKYCQYETATDKAEDNYFLYLAKGRAISQVFPRGITNFKIDNSKKLIVIISSETLDAGVSADWKKFSKIRRDEWIKIGSRIKREIGELVSSLIGNFVVEANLKEAKKSRPDLSKIIDEISAEEKWMAIEGKRVVIEEAEKRLNNSVSKLMESKIVTTANEQDLNNIRESSLMQLTATRWADLSRAVQICNDPNVDEKEIHNLLYTQKTNSDSEEINRLWLLDERWQYAEYVSSENTVLEMLGLNENEKNISSFDIFSKHGIDLSQISDKLSDNDFKKEFNKRPDIAIFNDDSVVIIELKKPGVDLINHTEKIKYYASLIAFLNKNKYKKFYCYLIGSQLPILNDPYLLTADRKGYFNTSDLKLRKRSNKGEIEEESTNAKVYYEVCEYDKFLKDCYFQHLEFFRAIGKKIEKLEAFLPEKFREAKS